MFWSPPSQEQLNSWGGLRTIDDYPEPEQEVWHEHYDAVIWFRSIMSQMRYNGFGATGLDYQVAYRDFDDMEIHGTERDRWKWMMKVMESKALFELNNRPA